MKGPAAACVALLAALASPSALAATMEIVTASDMRAEGTYEISLPGGSMVAYPSPATATYRLVAARGVVELWQWAAVGPCSPLDCVSYVNEPPTRTAFRVDGSDLAFAVVDERFRARVVANGTETELTIVGVIDATGRPAWLDRPVDSPTGDPPPTAPPSVKIRWQAGWPFFGGVDVGVLRESGFPNGTEARWSVEGAVRFQASDGNVTFVDAEGTERRFRLGNWTEESVGAPASPASVRLQRWSRLIFDGTVDGADFPAGAQWGASGPSARWRLVGDGTWRGADGFVERDGRRVEFVDADVRAAGDFLLRADGQVVAADLAPVRYRADGDFDTLTVGGSDPFAAGPRPGVAPVVGLGALLVAGLAGAARLVGAFYTRIERANVLAHPKRAAIWEIVLAEPGVYKEELHRRVGGAWGPFTFHLRVLQGTGYVRVERFGKYAVVRPVETSAAAEPIVPHPVARRVWAALPAGGSIAFGELHSKLGLSRQLLRYHLAQLESRNLVRLTRGATRRLFVERRDSTQGVPPRSG